METSNFINFGKRATYNFNFKKLIIFLCIVTLFVFSLILCIMNYSPWMLILTVLLGGVMLIDAFQCLIMFSFWYLERDMKDLPLISYDKEKDVFKIYESSKDAVDIKPESMKCFEFIRVFGGLFLTIKLNEDSKSCIIGCIENKDEFLKIRRAVWELNHNIELN